MMVINFNQRCNAKVQVLTKSNFKKMFYEMQTSFCHLEDQKIHIENKTLSHSEQNLIQ